MEELVNEVAALFFQAIEKRGEEWASAVVPFEVSGSSRSAGVAYYTKLDGAVAGLRLERTRSFELADQLTSELSTSTGGEVCRVRVTVRSDMSTSIEHFGPRAVPGILQHFGVWPDEPDYDGPVVDAQPLAVLRKVDPSYRKVSLADVAPVAESWERIDAWFGSNALEFAGLLNSPSSLDRIVEVEELLDVRFPTSLRESYLVHDGQRGPDSGSSLFHLMGWRSLDSLVEASGVLKQMERDDVASMIPVGSTDGGHVYLRSVADSSDESELVEWAAGDSQDFLHAVSFGAFLEQFADDLEAGKYVFRVGQLHEVDQLEEFDFED